MDWKLKSRPERKNALSTGKTPDSKEIVRDQREQLQWKFDLQKIELKFWKERWEDKRENTGRNSCTA